MLCVVYMLMLASYDYNRIWSVVEEMLMNIQAQSDQEFEILLLKSEISAILRDV